MHSEDEGQADAHMASGGGSLVAGEQDAEGMGAAGIRSECMVS
jgi:hypothetical protein